MSKKRILTISLVVALVVLAAAGSWIAGATIKSPAEAAARTAPPKASPILVPVEERVLSSDIIARGTARFGLPQAISIIPSALKSNPGIITTLPVRNTQLHESDVILTASGRPVFILRGNIPTYRDLTPGLSGDDVRQLEESLLRLGFDPGPSDGFFDEKTSAAVAAWYTAAGFEPFGPTPDQLTNIRTMETDLALAINDKLAADDAAVAAPLAVEAAGASAAHDVAVADAGAKAAAELAGKVAIQAAIDAQKAAEREAKRLNDLAVHLVADLEIARQKTGVQVPADEIVFIPSLPVRVEDVKAALGDGASGPVITVTNNQLAIDSSLPLNEAPLVKPGMAVAIDEPDLGIKTTGVVKRVATIPGTDGVDGYHVYLEILVDQAQTSLVGSSLRLTIPVESTGGKVIAVPVSALSLAADGTSRVQVADNGALKFMTVEPGLSANGYVAVTPVTGTLTPGQLVVIGFEQK
ncbi:MAG: peptidoglycan-binding protein [Chloroflexi bacterium]|nr:peptidoglycan-binding protein [Chloroflexota bacterium]